LYSHLQRIEPRHWFYAGRRRIILNQVRQLIPHQKRPRILDLGCGTGYDMHFFKEHGYVNAVGLDISLEALRFCQENLNKNLIRGDAIELPFSNNSFDIVLALDIIEQLSDDDVALKEQLRILKPGGVLVLFTPAYKFLRSFHDDVYHNLRRYEIDELHHKVSQAGLTICKLTYLNTFLFPLIVIARFVMRMLGRPKYVTSENDLHPTWSNSAFKNIFSIERIFLNHINFPFGTSILCVARK
jgi:ubiquinone/menaquinone biosynthesis C-methylase UbiE